MSGSWITLRKRVDHTTKCGVGAPEVGWRVRDPNLWRTPKPPVGEWIPRIDRLGPIGWHADLMAWCGGRYTCRWYCEH